MIDVTRQIDSVRREVGRRAVDGGEVRAVSVSRSYDVPAEELWAACTDRERIPQWFLPVSGELRTGGRYQLENHAGGTVERCDPPRGFLATWEYGGDVSRVELRLTPEREGSTRLELAHLDPDDDAKWARFGPGAVGVGWEMALVGLTLHLSSGAPVDPARAMSWFGSPEGLAFVEAAAENWYTAHVTGGEDPAVARAAADRTRAAYTGEDPSA
ncbi:SRPBCC domain-containing protein [Streptomyces sp. NPDC053367]|uniref:SRPBCC domain-containing protein n=1 Tax=Streptomyces sp. NPDC053367 TaxID=3365700 RepID=UPI0037D62821